MRQRHFRPFSTGFALAVVFLWSSLAHAADRCPRGVKQEQTLKGDDGEISWYSNATLERIEDKDWCYDRRVVVHKPERQYVNWPNGGVDKLVVEKELTTASCCYPGPRIEDGDLEHGYSGKRISTKVYRGSGEPRQSLTWLSISGSIYLEPRIVQVDVTLRSAVRRTPKGFEYTYEITNSGDQVTAAWNSPDSEFFRRTLREFKLDYPLVLQAKSGVTKASGFSLSPPEYVARDLILRSANGVEAFRISAPAYIPK